MPTDPTPPKLGTEDGNYLGTEDGDAIVLESSPPPIVYGKPKKFVLPYRFRRPVRSR